MVFVESKMYCAIPPISIKSFDQQKSINSFKQKIDLAKLYIIGKREMPEIRINDKSTLSEKIDGYDEEKFVSLSIKMCNKKLMIDAVFQLPNDLNKVLFKKKVNNITIEDILFAAAHNDGRFICFDNIAPLITYDVLYVGECIKEPLTKRFIAHHALQKMLIEEDVIFKKFDKADELILIPIIIDSYTMFPLTADNMNKDSLVKVREGFNFGYDEITLDAEKALVHNMNPKYNKIKFSKYPYSVDGLYETDASVFSYALADYIILKYDNGVVIGCPDDNYASKILGDDEGNTKIYNSNEEVVSKVLSRFMESENTYS